VAGEEVAQIRTKFFSFGIIGAEGYFGENSKCIKIDIMTMKANGRFCEPDSE